MHEHIGAPGSAELLRVEAEEDHRGCHSFFKATRI